MVIWSREPSDPVYRRRAIPSANCLTTKNDIPQKIPAPHLPEPPRPLPARLNLLRKTPPSEGYGLQALPNCFAMSSPLQAREGNYGLQCLREDRKEAEDPSPALTQIFCWREFSGSRRSHALYQGTT